MKKSKCHFGQRRIRYLGYQISENKIEPLDDNIQAILKAEALKTTKGVKAFLGQVNYYHRFVPNRAATLHPLYELTEKNRKFEWNEAHQKCFDQIKSILASEPVLRIYNPEYETMVYTDASTVGIGAVLKQKQPNGEELPISYFSKKLQMYQKNYSASELECLAILLAIENWKYWLTGKRFTIVTDHKPLESIRKNKSPGTRLFNWTMRLNQFDFFFFSFSAIC